MPRRVPKAWPPVAARPLTKAALFSVLALFLWACASSNCRERLSASKQSPHRLYTAAAFVRNCGAGKVLTHVNLHDGVGEPRAGLDGLISSGEVFSVEGTREVSLVWKDRNNLLVECKGCASQKVSKKESVWRDVQIAYADR